MKIEMKEIIIALIFIVFGVLVIILPTLLSWVVGIAFIILGLAELIPKLESKKK